MTRVCQPAARFFGEVETWKWGCFHGRLIVMCEERGQVMKLWLENGCKSGVAGSVIMIMALSEAHTLTHNSQNNIWGRCCYCCFKDSKSQMRLSLAQELTRFGCPPVTAMEWKCMSAQSGLPDEPLPWMQRKRWAYFGWNIPLGSEDIVFLHPQIAVLLCGT